MNNHGTSMKPENRLGVVSAPAKVNRRLSVLGKRPDGYHELELEFFPVTLADLILFESGVAENEVRFYQRNLPEIHPNFFRADGENAAFPDPGTLMIKPDIPVKNTVAAALDKMTRLAENPEPLRVSVIKNIPDGAGLGGGSSDAAAVLLFLNDYFSLNLDAERLESIALEIGSDVPFFLKCEPGLYGGRGEKKLIALPCPDREIIILKPGFGVQTGEAFRALPPDRRARLANVSGDFFSMPAEVNDFWHEAHPGMDRLKALNRSLEKHGAENFYMSGSGSVLYFPAENFDTKSFQKENPETTLYQTKFKLSKGK